jgi:signal peptidase I
VPLTSFLTALAQEQQSSTGLREFIDSAARTPLSKVVVGVVILTALRIAIAPYLKKTPPHMRLGFYPVARFFNEVLDAIIYAGVFVFMIIRPFGIQAFLIPSGSMWPTLYVNDFIVANKAIYRYTDPKDGDVVVFRPPVEATFNHPEQLDSDGNVNVDFIKRCIGVPGDVIELRDGVLYRNGKPAPDPYKHYSVSHDGDQTFDALPQDQVELLPKANFKWIKWNGQIYPLNYTHSEANAATSGFQGSYEVAPKFVIQSQADQLRAIEEPPEPIPPGYYMMMGDNRNNSFDSRGWGLVPRASIIGRSELIWLPISRIGRTH